MASFSNGLTITRSEIFEFFGVPTAADLYVVPAGRYAIITISQNSGNSLQIMSPGGRVAGASTCAAGSILRRFGSVSQVTYVVHVVEFAAGG